MSKFIGANKVGLRSRENGKLIVIYPHNIRETDKETEKAVRNWYYQISCDAEKSLHSAYVDIVTEEEIKARNL